MKQRDLTAAMESLLDDQHSRRKYWEESSGWDTGRPALDLHEKDLRGLKFELDSIKNKHLNLAGTDFQGADLRGARMQGIGLMEADFQGADLRGARLQKASLVGANFEGADLRGVSFRGANLQDANLEGVISDPDTFRGARMNGEPTLWETVQQKAAAWVDRLAEQEPAERKASSVSWVDTAWDQAVSQPLERAKHWLGAQQAAVVERVENWRDERTKAAAERADPAEERGQRDHALPASQGRGDPPQERENEPDGRTPRAPAAPQRSVEEVARDEGVAKRVGQMQDAARRAEAERLLQTIREEAAARKQSQQRTQEVALDR